MKRKRLEQKRMGLLKSLIFVIMILVATIMYLASGSAESHWISILAIVCLVFCLVVLFQEKELRQRQTTLRDELDQKEQVVDELGRELTEGRFEIVEGREKAEELEGRLREVTMLYRAINKVNAEPNSDQVSHTALRAALALVGGDRGSIMLLDKDKQHLSVETSVGIEKKVARATRQKVGEGVAGWVAQFGEPARISGEAQDDGRFQRLTESTGRIKSALCIPLKLENETIGVMNLGMSESVSDEFSEYHMSLATIFGEHASVAIMYNRLRRSLSNGEFLLADAGLTN